MITTPDLINALAADAAPVRRLHPPSVRAAVWLTFAALLLAALTSSMAYGPTSRSAYGGRFSSPGTLPRCLPESWRPSQLLCRPSRPFAPVAHSANTKPPRLAIDRRLRMPDQLGKHRSRGSAFWRNGPVLCDIRRAIVARDAGDAAPRGGAAANGGDNDRQYRDRRYHRDGRVALS